MNPVETKKGVCVSGFTASGVREMGQGVAVIACERVCECAGVFTKNSVKAAPLVVTEGKLKNGLQAVVVNSGNANACTPSGLEDAEAMCRFIFENLGVPEKNVAVASTGLIGAPLDLHSIEELTKRAAGKLGCSEDNSLDAAKAIMTTDTKPKMFSAEINGVEVGAIAKGSGMIAPNMATMLCFITTNADLSGEVLQKSLSSAVDKSLNMLVVDGETSTNDMVLLMSSGTVKCSLGDFRKTLEYVTLEIARKLASDGEGATKYFEVEVVNATDAASAKKACKALLSSPLVKTALYGENPNWGRILSRIGSKIKVEFEKVEITFSDGVKYAVALRAGKPGDRGKVGEVLKSSKVYLTVNLNSGAGRSRGFGCDMSREYVKINAEYN